MAGKINFESRVNQRKSKSGPRGTTKAVSEKLFSAAMSCITASGSHCSSRQTPAGFPPNRLLEKASTSK